MLVTLEFTETDGAFARLVFVPTATLSPLLGRFVGAQLRPVKGAPIGAR